MALASAVMSVAVVGMHYTGMAAVEVEGPPSADVSGISPLVLLLPILILAMLAIVGMVFGVLASPALDTVAQDERDRNDRPSATVRLADAAGQ
jgi:NO-binding membrane sensor protein with MHYT domain